MGPSRRTPPSPTTTAQCERRRRRGPRRPGRSTAERTADGSATRSRQQHRASLSRMTAVTSTKRSAIGETVPVLQLPWPEAITVTDPESVALLLDVKTLRLLPSFLRGPATLTEAARALQVPVTSLHYWIAKFLRAGLLVQIDTVRRAG